MTYPELKDQMLNGIQDEIYIGSISGLLTCYEMMGLTTDAAIDKLAEVLNTISKKDTK